MSRAGWAAVVLVLALLASPALAQEGSGADVPAWIYLLVAAGLLALLVLAGRRIGRRREAPEPPDSAGTSDSEPTVPESTESSVSESAVVAVSTRFVLEAVDGDAPLGGQTWGIDEGGLTLGRDPAKCGVHWESELLSRGARTARSGGGRSESDQSVAGRADLRQRSARQGGLCRR